MRKTIARLIITSICIVIGLNTAGLAATSAAATDCDALNKKIGALDVKRSDAATSETAAADAVSSADAALTTARATFTTANTTLKQDLTDLKAMAGTDPGYAALKTKTDTDADALKNAAKAEKSARKAFVNAQGDQFERTATRASLEAKLATLTAEFTANCV